MSEKRKKTVPVLSIEQSPTIDKLQKDLDLLKKTIELDVSTNLEFRVQYTRLECLIQCHEKEKEEALNKIREWNEIFNKNHASAISKLKKVPQEIEDILVNFYKSYTGKEYTWKDFTGLFKDFKAIKQYMSDYNPDFAQRDINHRLISYKKEAESVEASLSKDQKNLLPFISWLNSINEYKIKAGALMVSKRNLEDIKKRLQQQDQILRQREEEKSRIADQLASLKVGTPEFRTKFFENNLVSFSNYTAIKTMYRQESIESSKNTSETYSQKLKNIMRQDSVWVKPEFQNKSPQSGSEKDRAFLRQDSYFVKQPAASPDRKRDDSANISQNDISREQNNLLVGKIPDAEKYFKKTFLSKNSTASSLKSPQPPPMQKFLQIIQNNNKSKVVRSDSKVNFLNSSYMLSSRGKPNSEAQIQNSRNQEPFSFNELPLDTLGDDKPLLAMKTYDESEQMTIPVNDTSMDEIIKDEDFLLGSKSSNEKLILDTEPGGTACTRFKCGV